jgi:hypothetical protein
MREGGETEGVFVIPTYYFHHLSHPSIQKPAGFNGSHIEVRVTPPFASSSVRDPSPTPSIPSQLVDQPMLHAIRMATRCIRNLHPICPSRGKATCLPWPQMAGLFSQQVTGD